MTRFRSSFALPALSLLGLLLPGCPQSMELDTGSVTDTGPMPDVPVVPRDVPVAPFDDGVPIDAPEELDAGTPDTGSPETCTMPGTIESVPCGMCGSQDRFCTTGRIWEYSMCTGERGECEAGTTRDVSCGRCGTARERCDAMCTWAAGACTGETGICTPGEVELSTMGCAAGEIHRRTCDAMCAWGAFDMCMGSPDDGDGDGSGSAVDCDDTNPRIFPGTLEDCGNFICNDPMGFPTFVRGTRSCVGPGFSACMRPPGCPEAPDSVCRMFGPMGFESRTCPRGRWDCSDTEQTRSCVGPFGSEVWSPWSPTCPAPVTTPPPGCDGTATACGICGEGLQFTSCNRDCVPTTGACEGRGCTPGVRTRTTAGCPSGEYRESVCSAACVPGTAGACMPYVPAVDVMLLIDNTGSHTATVMRSAMALADDLVAPLAADMDVRVGVSTYADYPVSFYGSPPDEPFRGILAPTTDTMAVATAIRGIASRGGGDWPESLIEGLAVLAGMTPHPMSFPFATCPAGTSGGGCWRTGAQRVIVVITDAPGHGMPDSMGGIADPYGPDLTPAAPTWTAVRAALATTGTSVFYIVASTDFGGSVNSDDQAVIVSTQLGIDPVVAVEIYTSDFMMDLGPQARALAPRIATYVGSVIGP